MATWSGLVCGERVFCGKIYLNSSTYQGLAQSVIDASGKRSSSATAYIKPASARPNIDILLQSQVTRLIQTETTNKIPSFKKVELATGPSGTTLVVITLAED